MIPKPAPTILPAINAVYRRQGLLEHDIDVLP